MQNLFKKWFGQDGRLNADKEAAAAVAKVDKSEIQDKKESGATAIEYGLIAALIAVATVGAMTTLGGNLSSTFSEVSAQL